MYLWRGEKREMVYKKTAWLEVISISGKLASFQDPHLVVSSLAVWKFLFAILQATMGLRMGHVGINAVMLGVII